MTRSHMGINILIDIGTYQRGFLISLAQMLSGEHNVTILTNTGSKNLVKLLAPELEECIVIRPEVEVPVDGATLIQECLQREEKYGEKFSMISSHDRGLGKGYLFNADKHPNIVLSWWSHEEKLREMLKGFLFYERLISKYSPDLFIVHIHNKIPSIVARHNQVPILAVSNARVGSRYMWVENEFLHNSHFATSIEKFLEEVPGLDNSSQPEYAQLDSAKSRHSQITYSYRTAFIGIVRRILRETYWRFREPMVRLILRRGARKAGAGYRFSGWIGPTLRRPRMYKYLSKHGVTPEELSDYRVVFFPLHLEPEIALLSVSPEFNNSMEAIAWISKSLPADAILVVKEQPFSFGIRSQHYYDNLRRIGNVMLARPSVHPWEWIKAAAVVSTITGTAGYEAVHFKKPVLSFGKHQAINRLPTVRFANNYESTRRSVEELLAINPADESFGLSQRAIYAAQLEASFDLPAFEEVQVQKQPKPEFAQLALEKLYEQYPNILRRN